MVRRQTRGLGALIPALALCCCGGGLVSQEGSAPAPQPSTPGEPQQPAPQQPAPQQPAPSPDLTGEEQPPAAAAGPADCGDSYNCMIRAAAGCSPAFATLTETMELFGVKLISKGYAEIRTAPGQSCALYQRVEAADIEFPPGTPAETVESQRKLVKLNEGKDGTCIYESTTLLVQMLQDRKAGNYEISVSYGSDEPSTEPTPGVTCTGTLFETTTAP